MPSRTSSGVLCKPLTDVELLLWRERAALAVLCGEADVAGLPLRVLGKEPVEREPTTLGERLCPPIPGSIFAASGLQPALQQTY